MVIDSVFVRRPIRSLTLLLPPDSAKPSYETANVTLTDAWISCVPGSIVALASSARPAASGIGTLAPPSTVEVIAPSVTPAASASACAFARASA